MVPELIATLSNLFSWARTIDSEIQAHNMRAAQLAFAQGGDSAAMPALPGVEARARPGLPGSVLVGTRLVDYANAAVQIWPPVAAVDMDFIERLTAQSRAMLSGWELSAARGEAAARDSQIAGEYFDNQIAQAEARQAAENPESDSLSGWYKANQPGLAEVL